MAVAYLNPDGASSVVGWDASYSTTAAHLAQGETSNTWRTVFLQTGKAIFTLSDFNDTGVASITKIENIVVCGLDARSGTAPLICAIRNSGGTTLYSETFNNPASGFTTFTGTARTTSDGTAAWTDSDLDGLGLFLTATGGPHVHVIQQLYIKVTYEETAAGYGNTVIGIPSAKIDKITGLSTANISKVIGI
tara:strand:- start:1001 stop:1576 length:576 start_codon:yes stop_codon:yes gene_type:complete